MSGLIATSYKAKISHQYSYPLGAEAISEALIGVRQFDELKLSFSSHSTSYLQDVRKKNEYYEIFHAKMYYILPSIFTSKEGPKGQQWEIHMYTVPRELKSIATEYLLTEGLPNIRQWLEAPRTETWKMGRKVCAVFFQEKEPSFRLSEYELK